MKIVIINHYAGSPNLGMEFRPYYLAKEWIKKGHHVMIVGGSFSHLRAKQPVINSIVTRETNDGVEYIWLKTNTYLGNSIGRMWSMFVFVWRLFMNLRSVLDATKPDLIIASSTYPLDNFPAFYLSRRYNCQYCYEVHDLWPLSPMELGGYRKYHPFILVMQWAENFAYNNANFVVSMLPKTLEHMMEHGLSKEKFVFIPNGISIDEWGDEPIPAYHANLIRKLRKKNIFLVGYVGGHAISNALGTLIDAAAIALNEAPYLTFVLVGNGVEKEKLVNQVQKLSLPNVYFMPPVPKKSVPELLNSMDALYLGWHNNPLYRFGISPNKLIDYMMAGKPVVHSVRAGNDMVEESACGVSVEPENPRAVVEALVRIAKMPEDARIAMGTRGTAYILKHNDYKILAQNFIDRASQSKNT